MKNPAKTAKNYTTRKPANMYASSDSGEPSDSDESSDPEDYKDYDNSEAGGESQWLTDSGSSHDSDEDSKDNKPAPDGEDSDEDAVFENNKARWKKYPKYEVPKFTLKHEPYLDFKSLELMNEYRDEVRFKILSEHVGNHPADKTVDLYSDPKVVGQKFADCNVFANVLAYFQRKDTNNQYILRLGVAAIQLGMPLDADQMKVSHIAAQCFFY